MPRDEFSELTKRTLAARAGHVCSICGAPTSGPQLDQGKSVNAGDAAHITAASVGGPRYDPSLTSDERADHKNGIWLCVTHARIVDQDQSEYTTDELRRIKALAESNARQRLGKPADAGPAINAAVVVSGPNAINISGHNAVVLGPNAISISGPVVAGPCLRIEYDRARHFVRHPNGRVEVRALVRNAGSTTAKGVQIKIESLIPITNEDVAAPYCRQFPALPLQVTREPLEFSLQPHGIAELRIVAADKDADWIVFDGYDIHRQPDSFRTPRATYRLSLIATAHAAESDTRDYQIVSKADGEIDFVEERRQESET